MRSILKPLIEILAGIPTVVFGYFALTFFTPNFLQGFLNMEVNVFNALSAGLIMGFMVMPTIASVAEDAMSAVPASLREGSFGLGANRSEISTRGQGKRPARDHRRGNPTATGRERPLKPSQQNWKILGSAQRRHRGVVLQHGSLLLDSWRAFSPTIMPS